MDNKIIDFSIIIPVYNTEKFLNRCFNSVVNQKYDSYEIVLINDGSTDNSEEKIIDFIKMNKQVKINYIKTENNGQSIARNIGINNASGKYLIFLDSDDALNKNSLNKLSRKIKNKEPDIIINRIASYNEQSDTISECKYQFSREDEILSNAYINFFTKRKNFWFATWTFVVNRDFMIQNSLFFHPNLFHEDELWAVQMLLKSNKIMANNYPYYLNTSDRAGSLMTKKNIKKDFDKLIIVSYLIKLLSKTNALAQKKFLKRRIFLLLYQVYSNMNLYIANSEYEDLKIEFHKSVYDMYHFKSFFILMFYRVIKLIK